MSKTQKTSKSTTAKSKGGYRGAAGGRSWRVLGVQPFSRRTRGGTIFLLAVLVLLSFLAGLRLEPAVRVFDVGQVATQDVTATRDLLVEERASTEAKREEAARNQPPIFDLVLGKGSRIERMASRVFSMLDKARMSQLDQLRWDVAEYLNADISRPTLNILRNSEIQNLVFIRIIPWLEEHLRQGVVLDARLLQRFDRGIIVRETGQTPPSDKNNPQKAAVGEAPPPSNETLRVDIYQIPDMPALERRLEEFLHDDLNLSWRTRKSLLEFLVPMLEPSLALNSEATSQRRIQAMESVDPVYYNIKRGEMVVRAGQRVDAQTHLKLQALSNKEQGSFDWFGSLGILLLGILFTVGLTLRPTGQLFKPLANRDALLVGTLVLIFASTARLLSAIDTVVADKIIYVTPDMFPFSYPIAGAAGLLALFLSPRLCIFSYLLISFLTCQMIGADLNVFLFFFLGSMLQMVLIKRSETRLEVFKSVLPLIGGLMLVWLAVNFLQFHGYTSMGAEALMVIVNGLLSLLVVFALSPIVEMVFGYTSRFRLMELMNLEQPLLQELMVSVPGTYHHSLIVANMSEAGARAIGANPLLCKVAALYHDIGKIKNPTYFIENQYGKKNPHDKLSPSMSALILTAHVKKGIELAEQHKLGPEITDLLQQHHGTSLIAFFHNKALEQAKSRGAETVREEDYRYPGPNPQTKEAGILMLADAIEASSRTLIDPTPSRIKGHIQSITRKIFTEGQLDESQLTLKDLHLLGDAFHRILTGIFHQRIEYPSQQRQGKQAKPPSVPTPPTPGTPEEEAEQRAPEIGPPEPARESRRDSGDEDLPPLREPLQ